MFLVSIPEETMIFLIDEQHLKLITHERKEQKVITLFKTFLLFLDENRSLDMFQPFQSGDGMPNVFSQCMSNCAITMEVSADCLLSSHVLLTSASLAQICADII